MYLEENNFQILSLGLTSECSIRAEMTLVRLKRNYTQNTYSHECADENVRATTCCHLLFSPELTNNSVGIECVKLDRF